MRVGKIVRSTWELVFATDRLDLQVEHYSPDSFIVITYNSIIFSYSNYEARMVFKCVVSVTVAVVVTTAKYDDIL